VQTTTTPHTTTPSQPIVVSTTSISTISLPPIVLVPSSSPESTPISNGSIALQTPRPITFPTTPYTGQALLTGTCIDPEFTTIIQPDGSILELPVIGCADSRPGCCPWLPPVSPSTSTVTLVQLVTYQTVVASALLANPLTICPADYSEIGTACCPLYA
jgi:hypothetical protein